MNRPHALLAALLATCLRSFAQAGALPSPEAAYRLSPDDVIDVAVYQDRELNRKARVDADGSIALPLVGSIKVAGSTIPEAQRLIERKLSTFIVEPRVALSLEAYGGKVLFVLGEVQKPGPYPLRPGSRMTVLQAVTDAGGLTKVASPKNTRVLRSAGGKSQDYKVDLKAVIGQGAQDKDMSLEPNDVVYVPQSFF